MYSPPPPPPPCGVGGGWWRGWMWLHSQIYINHSRSLEWANPKFSELHVTCMSAPLLEITLLCNMQNSNFLKFISLISIYFLYIISVV